MMLVGVKLVSLIHQHIILMVVMVVLICKLVLLRNYMKVLKLIQLFLLRNKIFRNSDKTFHFRSVLI